MDKQTFITDSFRETEKLGEKFANKLQGGDVVCLIGDLGSGKTTFVKGVAIGLGIKSRIMSPTFVLVRSHKINLKSTVQISSLQILYHIDLYRLESEDDIKGLGLEELFNDKNSVIIIEWAEKLGNLRPAKRWEIKFEHRDKNEREIEIKKVNN